MGKTDNLYLCGGTFFFVLQLACPHISPRENRNGISDKNSAPLVMQDLIFTFTGSYNYSTAKDTSKYANCTSEGSVNVPFNDIAIATSYDNTVKSNYSIALDRMMEFTNAHINTSMKEFIVKALLDIISNDQSIKDSDEFFINSNGQSTSKGEMINLQSFELEPFLVGVLHFILSNRRDSNYSGASTLDLISNKTENRPRKYIGHLGDSITHQISVILHKKTAEPAAESKKSDSDVLADSILESGIAVADVLQNAEHKLSEEIKNGKTIENTADSNEHEHNDSETYDNQTDEASMEDTKKTVIQQQTNVVQNGDNNVNITNNGTINFKM